MDVANQYSSDTKIAFLDPDEVEALLTSMNIITQQVLATVPATYTEVVYSSRGGFSAGCYWSKNEWTGFIKLEKFDSDSYVWFKGAKFLDLKSILEGAKAAL